MSEEQYAHERLERVAASSAGTEFAVATGIVAVAFFIFCLAL